MSKDKLTKPVVAANWKMHPRSATDAQKLFAGVKRTAPHLAHPTTVICVPDLYLGLLADSYGGSEIILGSQDVSLKTGTGSFTGEVSAEQTRRSGGKISIIGHSERRKLGETNKVVAKKASRALQSDLSVIVCIGEKSRDDEGEYLTFLKKQIQDVYSAVDRRFYNHITLAYEPLWAIGGGADKAITPHILHQTIGFIRKVLHQQVARGLGEDTNIIYGGSVKRDNARKLFSGTGVDGFLPGGASLDADHFCDILRIVNDIYKDRHGDE